MHKIRILLHIQYCTVCSQSRVETCRHTRCQLTSNRCCTNKNRSWFYFIDEILKNRRIGFHLEIFKRLLIIDKHFICAIVQKFPALITNVTAHKQCIDGLPYFCCKFFRLSDKLICHWVNNTVYMIDVNCNPLPLTFIHLGYFRIRHKFHRAFRTILYTKTTHLTCRTNAYFTIFFFNRSKWTDCQQSRYIIYFILMYNKFCHNKFLPPQINFSSLILSYIFPANALLLVSCHISCFLSDSGGKIRCTCVAEPLRP